MTEDQMLKELEQIRKHRRALREWADEKNHCDLCDNTDWWDFHQLTEPHAVTCAFCKTPL